MSASWRLDAAISSVEVESSCVVEEIASVRLENLIATSLISLTESIICELPDSALFIASVVKRIFSVRASIFLTISRNAPPASPTA